ncbi:MAG: efflux transporter outer membrane subunit [Thermodesulfobacteriota bacterium]
MTQTAERNRISAPSAHGLLLRAGTLLAAWTVFVLAGCAPVGPDYLPPADPAPALWHTELREGLAAASLYPEELARWWATLDDPLLTELIGQAVKGNLDLRRAESRVREARARRGISEAGLFPALDAGATASRAKSGGVTRSTLSLGLDAGWEVDIFGGTQRAVEAAEANLAASREDLRDVLVTLTAEVALNYLEARTLQARLAAAQGNLRAQEQTLELVQARAQAGLSDELAVQEARASLESTGAQLPALRAALDEAKNRLALLLGTVPGAVHPQLAEAGPLPVIPATVAVGVPAETLRQRPDIRRAERNLAAQTAQVGVAVADLYPKLRLTGSIGLESVDSADLFAGASEFWRLGPGLSWKIFDAGAVRRNIEVQSALQEQSLLAYEAAVLAALAEVENALTAYAEEQVRRQNLLAAVDAVRQAEFLARHQYQAGLVDFTTVLIAQRSLLNLEDQLAQSNGTVTANLVRLYKALGGGWQSEPPPAAEPAADKG